MSEPNGSYLRLFSVENSIIVSVPCRSELARDIRRNREQARSHKTIRVHHQKSLRKCHSGHSMLAPTPFSFFPYSRLGVKPRAMPEIRIFWMLEVPSTIC